MVDAIFPTFPTPWDGGFRDKECTWHTRNSISWVAFFDRTCITPRIIYTKATTNRDFERSDLLLT